MFKNLWNELTWSHRFDDRFKFLQQFGSEYLTKRFEEKALYWRQHGRTFNLTPHDAFKRAVNEYCQEQLNSFDGKLKYRQRELHLMAKLMAWIYAPEQIPEFWQQHVEFDKVRHAYQSPFDD